MATMTDIAREAGVSLSTVSYALSGKRPISPATRERIQSAIDRLQYHPTASARALASQRTSLLGVAVPQREDVDAHVIMEFVSSILTASHEQDYDLLLVAAEDHERTRRVMDEGKVDALIVMDLVEDDPRIPSLAALPRPVVLIGYPQESGGLACVDFDFLSGAMLAVRELHARGSRRIGMLTSPAATHRPSPTYARRSRLGYTMACTELGIAPTIVEVPSDAESLGAFVREQLVQEQRFDALFVHQEPALAHLGRAFAAQGVACPEDVQIVAISPEDVAVSGPWDVSNVELPISSIGRTALAMLLEMLSGPAAPPHSRLLSPTFTPRDTTRA
ncbi:LacI family DNA-binding transcriptional regulator [Brachybacterium phenoliresistens]|uniref:LacI family DNA-binding transcriptional regulator n=1 Tax=Brachybacterium phenoliresistens TaxID=396014 RepID=UPI0031DB79CE